MCKLQQVMAFLKAEAAKQPKGQKRPEVKGCLIKYYQELIRKGVTV